MASLKLGALRLTNRFFPEGSKVHPSAVSSCRRHVAAMVSDFARRADQIGHEVMVGSSGTIEQLVRLGPRRRGRGRADDVERGAAHRATSSPGW